MELTVGLRIMSDNLESARITNMLDIQPTRRWEKGEMIETIKGLVPASNSSWCLYSSYDTNNNLEDELLALLAVISPRLQSIHRLKEEGYWIDICCNISSDEVVGFILSPQLLAQLAGLKLELDFAIHLVDSLSR